MASKVTGGCRRFYTGHVLDLVREHYADFGPTLAREKLLERHGLLIGRETLRGLMRDAGLWHTRAVRRKAIQQPRARRQYFGELIQIDGSEHQWFEDRGPYCTVMTYVDDATSRLQLLRFVEGESTFEYMQATKSYIERYGKPVAFYSDKHTVFHVNKRSGVGGNGMTQYGWALHELGIEIMCANTPAAKGRVKRAHGTLQNRLVKEMRLQGISTINGANSWIDHFVRDLQRTVFEGPCFARKRSPPSYGLRKSRRDFHMARAAIAFGSSNSTIRQSFVFGGSRPRKPAARRQASYGD